MSKTAHRICASPRTHFEYLGFDIGFRCVHCDVGHTNNNVQVCYHTVPGLEHRGIRRCESTVNFVLSQQNATLTGNIHDFLDEPALRTRVLLCDLAILSGMFLQCRRRKEDAALLGTELDPSLVA